MDLFTIFPLFIAEGSSEYDYNQSKNNFIGIVVRITYVIRFLRVVRVINKIFKIGDTDVSRYVPQIVN